MKYFLGFDLGSSSVKAALLDASTRKTACFSLFSVYRNENSCTEPGFAEQDPEYWWQELVQATSLLHSKYPFQKNEIGAIGISYQMHGLVCLDKNNQPLRPAIIWCDSRAVDYGAELLNNWARNFVLNIF